MQLFLKTPKINNKSKMHRKMMPAKLHALKEKVTFTFNKILDDFSLILTVSEAHFRPDCFV